MPNFILSEQARRDIDSIWYYIAEDNINAADKVECAIYDACQRLTYYPQMGVVRNDLTSKNVRFWKVYSYWVIYRAHTKSIEIVRVLSQYRDIPAII